LWTGFIFIFFSLSKSKLIPYILPIFPALALLIGHYVVEAVRANKLSVKVLWGMGIGTIGCLIIFALVCGNFYNKTLKPVIAEVMPQVREGDVIISYDGYLQDLPVYTKRIVTVVNPRGEIRWGTTIEDTSAWTMDIPTFWQRWQQGEQRFIVFALAKDEDTILPLTQGQPVFMLSKTPRYIVFTNKQ